MATPGLFADTGFFESEPNNKPAEFNRISGAVTLYGTMTGSDQDGFVWTVSDEDARKRWTFELHGIPGALTIAQVVRLEYAENGIDVVGKTLLMKMGSRDGLRPSIHEDLIFEPGEYVLGLAQAGSKSGEGAGVFRPPVGGLSFGEEAEEPATTTESPDSASQQGSYRFLIHEQSLSVRKNPGPRESMENAFKLQPGNNFATYETGQSVWYRFNFNEKQAENRWDIRVQAPVGRNLRAILHAEDGQKLLDSSVDKQGRLRFPALAPPVGTWYLELRTNTPGFIHYVATEQAGFPVAGQEAEPNNSSKLANEVDFSQPLSGRIGDDDKEDYFLFSVDEASEDQLHTLRIDSPTPGKLSICLKSTDWRDVQCREGTPPLQMPDLLLSTGDWGIHLRKAEAQDYTITFEPQGPIEPGREVEPNDAPKYASGVPSNMRIKGRFDGDDTDIYQFIIDGEAQLWRFQVNGTGISSVAYLDGRGQQKAFVRAKPGNKRIRLDNVFLLPGRHSIRIKGADGEYTMLARPLGPPVASEETASAEPPPGTVDQHRQQAPAKIWNPDGEVEPNDQSNMQRLAVGQLRTGTLPDTEDQDFYRFFVANHDHLRLTITPPDDGSIHPYLYWYNYQLGAADKRQPGEVIQFEGLLPPGDYHLLLESEKPSDKPYQLTLERLPRFGCLKDCEPSGMGPLDTVSPVPRDLRLQGVAQEWRDKDAYQLPVFDHDTELLIKTPEPFHRAYLSDGQGDDSSWLTYDKEMGGYRVTLPADHPQRLVITGVSPSSYDAQLEFPNGELAPVTGDLDVDLSVELETRAVGAFLEHGQRLEGTVVAVNTGSTAVELALEAVTSDYRWSVGLAESRVNIDGGGQQSIPVVVEVPSDAWADHTLRLSIRALDAEGRQTEAWADIDVNRTAPAVNARHFWPIPDALRGGFNAAWHPFGATVTEESPKKVHQPSLRDDLVFPGAVMKCCRHDGSNENKYGPAWTLALPGDKPLPVAGIAIDSFGTSAGAQAIKRATLLLSQDGSVFEEALQFETLPVLTEQYFTLASPIPARFAQLRVEDTFENPKRDVTIGEWKVILEPGHDLSGGSGFNIADPELGGHLAYTFPTDSGAGSRILSTEDKSNWVSLGKNARKEYVIGFKRDRAAQIERIEWQYHELVGESDRNFRSVSISVSEHSPVGPWRSLGKMELTASDASGTLDLESPAWARFVRFEAEMDPESKRSREPGVIRIWERPGGDDYVSVLTEWGEAGGRAYYESLQEIPQATTLASDNDSRERAKKLAFGERSSGAVSLGRLQNWYRVNIPQDVNTLRLELTGDPTVRTVLALQDHSGNDIPVDADRSGRTPGRHHYQALVEPGQDVWVNVLEPPRNVVFSWDTSGSVGKYIPRIFNSVMAFSGEVQPGYEWVNLLPFGGAFLLSQWSDNPLVLQTVLNDFREESKSSAAEKYLYKAGQALAPRPGTKAIVVVTDAVTPYFGDMWKPMQTIQPRVFGVGVAGAGITEQNRFRDWAAVNGGDYRQLRYLGEMDVAFDRASTRMHRPAAYTLLAEGEYQEAPGPGKLRVRTGESQPQAAVELILDASGSMLQRIDGKRRINVAKEVLTEAVREHIPAGTPVALRVFGHKEVDACRTDLEIPLSPLNPDAAVKKISSIQAMNLARTPIADSLAAVAGDLKGAKSGAVVLVTDGEETCEGDPEAVVQSLQDKGFDINLNIVGFAIDDADLAAQFESWAELGNGGYFSAENQDGLSEAIEKALRIPFTVYDQGGNEVGAGHVGGQALELERGMYSVLVRTQPQQKFEDVEVLGEDQVVLELE